MKSTIILLVLMAITLTNCGSDDANDLTNSNLIRVDDELFSDAPNDDFEIVQASVDGDKLNLKIEYGGGCGDVKYDLLASTEYEETDPIQRNIRLAFFDDDNCEALLELDISIDITPIQISEVDSIVINLDGWANQLVYPY